MKIIIFCGFSYILNATVYEEVMILFSLTHWMETVLYSQMFYVFLWLSGRALREQRKGRGFNSQGTQTDNKCIT